MPRRLIEEAFPLKKVSEDSKHEKNPLPGHISSLHVWPARRPLAACRAVTIATLLPDPEDAPEKMKAEYTRLSGSPLPEKQREYLCNDLIGSLTRWKDENGQGDWDAKDQKGRWLNKLRIARELIQMAYNGDLPKVMDMFAGGGAIPFEAMRLGCEVTANDYNPVAWFLLKCMLKYPQRLAGKTAPLPDLNLDEKPNLKNGDLADHVRLWGQWVLENARTELTDYYPVIDNKPTVAYLWARTIPCQDKKKCGATVPLIKTLWVCKKAEKTLKDTPENRNRSDFLRLKETKNQTKVVINAKRALRLCADPETKQVRFEVFTPNNEDNVGKPTMSGTKRINAICPFCDSQQPADYIKRCGHEDKLKVQMTAVVYQEEYGKEYRLPTEKEIRTAEISEEVLESVAYHIPHGIPDEALPQNEILLNTLKSAIQTGLLMARRENKAYLKEAIPDAEITDDMELLAPLESISGSELSPNNLPDAWENETSFVGKLMDVLATCKGTPIPWSLIVDAVTDGVSKNLFEFTSKDAKWPCNAEEADRVGLKVSQATVKIAPKDLIGEDAKSAWTFGQSTLGLIKQALESKISVSIPDDVFRSAVKGAIDNGLIISNDNRLIILEGTLPDDFYEIRVEQGAWVRHTESHLTEIEIQDLAEKVIDLANIAPELDFQFRVSITAKGEPPSNEVLEQINAALQKVTDKLKFD